MKIPSKVQIGSQSWSIVERDRKDDLSLTEDSFAYTIARENLIVIDKTVSDSRKRQTLLHEILHAIRYSFGNPTTPKKGEDSDIWEHYFIAMYEEGILLVLRNNPQVLAYLLNKEA
jgi:hypothetical protein